MGDKAGGNSASMRWARWTFAGAAFMAVVLATASFAKEKPVDIVAAQVRMQGHACDKALRATRDRKASKPKETVWTLVCSNASYRVRLVPDMAARIDPLK
ncbi:MAG TPA: hypothetical protein VJ740_00430 [Hyphomicrobiaceae bacterium]|nr:hypothetical protein [Hyphomicrobiaceae bacterium]